MAGVMVYYLFHVVFFRAIAMLDSADLKFYFKEVGTNINFFIGF